MATLAFLVLIALGIFVGVFLVLLLPLSILKKSNQAIKRSARRTAPVRTLQRTPGKLGSINNRKKPRKDKNTETESLMKDFQDFHAEEAQKEALAKLEAEAVKREMEMISSQIDYKINKLHYEAGVWRVRENFFLRPC